MRPRAARCLGAEGSRQRIPETLAADLAMVPASIAQRFGVEYQHTDADEEVFPTLRNSVFRKTARQWMVPALVFVARL